MDVSRLNWRIIEDVVAVPELALDQKLLGLAAVLAVAAKLPVDPAAAGFGWL